MTTGDLIVIVAVFLAILSIGTAVLGIILGPDPDLEDNKKDRI